MESVSWNEVQRFIKKLDALDDRYTYRLPTEAEWEYAARAGTTTRFWFGEDPDYEQLREYGWYLRNTEGSTQPVAKLKPNPFGLYDMQGNVLQWVSDWYTDDASKLGGLDPTGPKKGTGRVARGGGFYNGPSLLRSATRCGYSPDYQSIAGGFRLVRTPK